MAEPLVQPVEARLSSLGWAMCLIAVPLLIVFGSPVLALLVGAVLGIGLDRAPFAHAGKLGKLALQTGIVVLAVRMDIAQVMTTGGAYVEWIVLFVPLVLVLGWWLAHRAGIEPREGKLISAGTAICGGTAIATLAPTIRARSEQLAVCLAIVFMLNAVAVLSFPWIGRAVGLSQEAFGVWAALAIHDTASVVAAAAQYGDQSLEVATTLKLARMLCLVPVVCLFAYWERSGSRASVPRFILLFVLVAGLASLTEVPAVVADAAGTISYALIVVALFFVGTELRRGTLLGMRNRVFAFASLFWLGIVAATLGAVLVLI